MCMTKKGVTAFFFHFFFLEPFFPPSSFYQHWAAVPYCMIKETRLVAAFVGRLWYRLTLDCTWMFLFLFLFFIFIFWEGEGLTLPTMALLKHTSLLLFVYEGRALTFIIFGTKDSLKKSNKKNKNTCSVKALFFSIPFRKLSRLRTPQHWNVVCWNLCLFKLDKVSLCQVQRPFQNKTCYCEATLIKRYKNGRQKKTFSVVWFVSSCSSQWSWHNVATDGTLLCSFWGFSSPNLVCGKSCKFNNKLMTCFSCVQFTCWMK